MASAHTQGEVWACMGRAVSLALLTVGQGVQFQNGDELSAEWRSVPYLVAYS